MIPLILLILGVSAQTCPKYTCGTSDKCLSFSKKSNTYQISPCFPNATCPIDSSSKESHCVDLQPEKSFNYPGEFCTWNSDCSSKSCLSNICQGVNQGGACINLYDCNPGLYCDQIVKTCEPQLVSGKACDTDDECVNTNFCLSGTCQSYFSQPNGYSFTKLQVNSTTGFNMVCASGFATLSGGTYTCATAPTNKADPTQTCTPGSQCTSSDGKYSLSCQCGYTESGNAYCPLFAGDAVAQNMITSWITLLKSYSTSTCNTMRRWGFQCFIGQSANAELAFNTFMQYYIAYAEGQWPLLQSNPNCVKQTLAKEYYDLQSAQTQYTISSCPVYFCASSSSSDQCIVYKEEINDFYVQETFYAKTCSDGKVCPATRTSNSTCADIETATRYPGDKCSDNSQCLSKSCDNNVCTGKAQGDMCEYIYDCNPGLYCNSGSSRCETQLAADGVCLDDYDCSNGLMCNLGNCIPYFTLNNGMQTDSVNNYGFSMACQTGFAAVNRQTNPPTGTCAVAPVSSTAKNCVVDSMCQDTTGTYSKPCTCGYNAYGLSFCPSFEGDQYLQTAIKAARTLLLSNSQCNTYSRLSEYCYLKYPKLLEIYYSYSINMNMYLNYPLLQENPNCIEKIYNADYYDAVQKLKNLNDNGSVVKSIFFGLLALMVLS